MPLISTRAPCPGLAVRQCAGPASPSCPAGLGAAYVHFVFLSQHLHPFSFSLSFSQHLSASPNHLVPLSWSNSRETRNKNSRKEKRREGGMERKDGRKEMGSWINQT